MTFEWDEAKARLNLQRHQIDFEEAKTVFNDPFLLTFPDVDHSEGEYRWKTTRKERKAYEEGDL